MTEAEYFYLLGFSPQNLKLDGNFHALKVTVKSPSKLNLQARRGYYAPKHVADPEEAAKQEIEDALFSREELHDLPVELHTQFFKASEDSAKLSVVVRVDVKHIRFRKAEGRNRNDLTIVSGLFDRNGNYIMGSSKLLQMRLKDGRCSPVFHLLRSARQKGVIARHAWWGARRQSWARRIITTTRPHSASSSWTPPGENRASSLDAGPVRPGIQPWPPHLDARAGPGYVSRRRTLSITLGETNNVVKAGTRLKDARHP